MSVLSWELLTRYLEVGLLLAVALLPWRLFRRAAAGRVPSHWSCATQSRVAHVILLFALLAPLAAAMVPAPSIPGWSSSAKSVETEGLGGDGAAVEREAGAAFTLLGAGRSLER